MKRLTKIFSLALSVLMLLSLVSIIGCVDEQGSPDQTTAAVVEDEETESLYDANGYLKSDLPEELDWGGETFTVFYWDDVEMQEFEAEEITSEMVNDAIYTRNANVEKKMGITLAWQSTKGNGGNITGFVNAIGNAHRGGETAIDLIASYSRTTALCAMEGYLADLSALPYLNFDMPWWPQSLLDKVPIGDKVYFVSGDASINVLHFMYGIYFNKDLIQKHGLDNPVELVRTKDWTVEKLISMTADLYQDLDQSQNKSDGDYYGFCTVDYHLDAFYTGSNLSLVEGDEDDLLIVSPDFTSERAIDLCTTLGDWISTQDVWDGGGESIFVNERAIFCQNRCYLADRKLVGEVDFSYGIVPTPLYDKNQEEYISVVGNPFTLFGIYEKSTDLDRAAAVLECWASEAYRTTTPAQFEVNLKTRYSETSDESEMYNIIRSTVCFDIGRLFNTKLADMTDIYFHAITGNENWKTTCTTNEKLVSRLLSRIVDDFREIE